MSVRCTLLRCRTASSYEATAGHRDNIKMVRDTSVLGDKGPRESRRGSGTSRRFQSEHKRATQKVSVSPYFCPNPVTCISLRSFYLIILCVCVFYVVVLYRDANVFFFC